jgi:hypothetical protein
MKRLSKLLFAISVVASSLVPQSAWARPAKNNHHVQHHKVRHAQRHKVHRTGT